MRTPIKLCTLCLLYAWSFTASAAPPESREQLNAVLWLQQSTEYKASALQTYRLAQRRLAALKSSGGTASVEQNRLGNYAGKPPAIVLDIDETILDNSPYNARLVKEGLAFDATSWGKWVDSRSAQAIPGAREFIRSARQLGYKVLFITNRECNKGGGYELGIAKDCPQQEATRQNLKTALGYTPKGDEILLRWEVAQRDDSDKTARREAIAQKHRIVMLLGDDLNDFIRGTDYKGVDHGDRWGVRWFMLSNPMYGSWEQKRTAEQKYEALQPWQPTGPPPTSLRELRIASWNMEWLADPAMLDQSGFWDQCRNANWPNTKLRPNLPYCDVYHRDGIDDAAAYESKKLNPTRAALNILGADQVDLIAVQEVQSASALAAVLPAGYKPVCFTSRDDAQNLGYAVRESTILQVTCKEISSLSLENDPGAGSARSRRGLELALTLGGRVTSLLNVHLKSRCVTGPMTQNNPHCRTLQRQIRPLEEWIEEQANGSRQFMVLGDLNRDIEDEISEGFPARSDNADPAGPLNDPTTGRNLFPEINDNAPATSAMKPVVMERSAASGANACHKNLDQIIVSTSLVDMLKPESLGNGQLPARLIKVPVGASDHCIIRTDLKLR